MGKSIYSATATDSRISQQKILLLIKKRGSYTLEFSGQSDSDTFGATITNVRL